MLYLLLVYTIPVSEFLDVVPNSDVSKSVTSRRPLQTRSRTMPYSAKVCSRVFSANNETRRGEGRGIRAFQTQRKQQQQPFANILEAEARLRPLQGGASPRGPGLG